MKLRRAVSSTSKEDTPLKCSTPITSKKLKASLKTTSRLKSPEDSISEEFSTPPTSFKPHNKILNRIMDQEVPPTPPDTPAATDYSTPMTSRAPKFRIKDKSLVRLDLNTTDDGPADDIPLTSISDTIKTPKVVLTRINLNKIDELIKPDDQSKDASESNGSQLCLTPSRNSDRSEHQTSNKTDI